ncbi:MAG: DinB family protein, partial [Armatimonadetes bacterium]|nr:DinB family protein [Armatimonadota bacterium]
DWETVWRERFDRTATEPSPELTRPDLNERADRHGYATADANASLAAFSERRAALLADLRALFPDAWNRVAHLGGIGDVTLAELLVLAQCHDSHHVRQVSLRLRGE